MSSWITINTNTAHPDELKERLESETTLEAKSLDAQISQVVATKFVSGKTPDERREALREAVRVCLRENPEDSAVIGVVVSDSSDYATMYFYDWVDEAVREREIGSGDTVVGSSHDIHDNGRSLFDEAQELTGGMRPRLGGNYA